MIDANAHPSRGPQIPGLIAEKAPTKVPVEYADFAFFLDLGSKLPKHTEINDYAIKLVDANGFIRPSKSPTGAPILFDWTSDGCLWLCAWGFNNLTMKNWFPKLPHPSLGFSGQAYKQTDP